VRSVLGVHFSSLFFASAALVAATVPATGPWFPPASVANSSVIRHPISLVNPALSVRLQVQGGYHVRAMPSREVVRGTGEFYPRDMLLAHPRNGARVRRHAAGTACEFPARSRRWLRGPLTFFPLRWRLGSGAVEDAGGFEDHQGGFWRRPFENTIEPRLAQWHSGGRRV